MSSWGLIEFIGHIWGALISAVVWNTAMRGSSMIRKIAMSAFFIHFGGIFFKKRK